MKKIVSSTLTALGSLLLVTPASAQDGSWLWPLYARVEEGGAIKAGQPRPALWGSAGEYQALGGVVYMHPGHDIRGDHGDVVLVPANAQLEHVYLYDDDCLKSGNGCRLWFAESGGRFLYYVAHLDLAPSPVASDRRQVSTEIRTVIQNAVSGSGNVGVTRGQKLANITMFTGVATGWHHLHVGVFDSQAQYAMRNTIAFFDLNAAGETANSSLYVYDDEPPTIRGLTLTSDDDPDMASAVTDGTCGAQINGPVDIVADIYDTYYTQGDFATFPGRDTLSPYTGIRTASYAVRNKAGTVISQGTWTDVDGLPLTCSPDRTGQACLLAGTESTITRDAFYARMDNEDGAPSGGTTLLDKLFNTKKSTSNYTVADGERYFHILTNAGGQAGVWNPAGLPPGRYQITALAEDFASRKTSKSMFVNWGAVGSASGDVYVRDRDDDIGAIPSNPGGEPFWQSPDIFVVPENTNIDVTSYPVQSQVTENARYWVWVRVRNDSCSAVSGVKARVLSANPAAFNTNWRAITSGDGFVGDEGNPNGEEVPAGGAAMIGPFLWIPNAEEAAQEGHRCLLAGISTDADALNVANIFDAPGQNNVAQRNMLVSGCSFQLPNPNATTTKVKLHVTTDAAVESASTTVELIAPYVPAWLSAWQGTPGIEVTVLNSFLIVKLKVRDITLPEVSMQGASVANLSFNINLPGGAGSHHASVEPLINSASVGGFSCYGVGATVPK